MVETPEPAPFSGEPRQLQPVGLHPVIKVVVLPAPAVEQVGEPVDETKLVRRDRQHSARHLRVRQNIPELVNTRTPR